MKTLPAIDIPYYTSDVAREKEVLKEWLYSDNFLHDRYVAFSTGINHIRNALAMFCKDIDAERTYRRKQLITDAITGIQLHSDMHQFFAMLPVISANVDFINVSTQGYYLIHNNTLFVSSPDTITFKERNLLFFTHTATEHMTYYFEWEDQYSGIYARLGAMYNVMKTIDSLSNPSVRKLTEKERTLMHLFNTRLSNTFNTAL